MAEFGHLKKTHLFNKLRKYFLVKQKLFNIFKQFKTQSKPKKYFNTSQKVQMYKNILGVKNRSSIE